MKTILVLSPLPSLPDQIRAALNPDKYRVVHRLGADDAAPLLTPALLDVCIVDVESASIEAFWLVEKLRRLLPKCPILLFTGVAPWEWEEEAYLQGVELILRKPVRGRAMTALLERLWSRTSTVTPLVMSAQPAHILPWPERGNLAMSGAEGIQTAAQSLKILRDFSAILTHSLCADEMLRQFLLRLREIISVNRAAIFLQQPARADRSPGRSGGSQLHVACAIGLTTGLLDHFELSFQSGIGAHLFRHGRILRRNSPEAMNEHEAQKEFEILGVQVAIPILDNESLVGIAVFDGRVTGEPLSNTELELVFHLLEQLGLAVKNIWLHGQLAANHHVLSDILRELNSACIVIGRELEVLHINKAARKLFSKTARAGADLEFTDLPQSLGTKIYQVLKTGSPAGVFRYSPEDAPDCVFNVSIVPLHRDESVLPTSALLTAEDLTQAEKLKRLEIEKAGLEQLKAMADKSAAEVGNALVPLSTYQQLLGERWKDRDFITSLDEELAKGVRRIDRRVEQWRVLASTSLVVEEKVAIPSVIDEAFREAQKQSAVEAAKLKFDKKGHGFSVRGQRKWLLMAFLEVMLNAIQANPSEPQIEVRIEPLPGTNGAPGVQLDIEDNGGGFSPQDLEKAGTAFWTRRAAGMGLGLAVARKAVVLHQGRFEILPPQAGRGGVVRIWLPAVAGPSERA